MDESTDVITAREALQLEDYHPGMSLVTTPFNGSNFTSWITEVETALRAKGKLGFINGDYTRPRQDSLEFEQWMWVDCMVTLWLLNSISDEIVGAFIYANSARDLWLSLAKRFGGHNGLRLYKVRREIASMTQGNMSVLAYFTRLEGLWMELILLTPTPWCPCQSSKAVEEINSQNQLMQFLMGLNESYNDLRNQILMMNPLPSVNRAYLMVSKVEQQRRKAPVGMVDVADDGVSRDLKRIDFIGLKLKKLMMSATNLDPLKDNFARAVVPEEYSFQESPKLPEDILINIFARLPAKSAGKCRCLAKKWRSLLSTPHFAKLHVAQHIHRENVIVSSHSSAIRLITNIDDLSPLKKFKMPMGASFNIFSSCHGLVVLVTVFMDEFLVNPTTKQLQEIPSPPEELKKGMNFYKCLGGLGYDSSMDDYKYVKYAYETGNPEADNVPVVVIVYSVKSGVWKRVEDSHLSMDRGRRLVGRPPFVNGALNWWLESVDSRHPLTIAAFSLVNEVFDEIPGPNDVDAAGDLTSLGGNLCLVSKLEGKRVDVWVMKENGVAESWMKFSVDVESRIRPLCYVGNEEVLFFYGGRLMAYDEKERRMRHVVDEYFHDASTFVESLVSPICSSN